VLVSEVILFVFYPLRSFILGLTFGSVSFSTCEVPFKWVDVPQIGWLCRIHNALFA